VLRALATKRGQTIAAAAAALTVLGAAASPSQAFRGFQSPSENIGCVIGKQGARCDIAQRSWKPPPAPASCEVDWGQGLELGRQGRAGYVCAGDTTLGAGDVLPYGESVAQGRFRCKSKPSGVRCVNRRNGHGFEISKDAAKLF
jgi:hypothetical protein